MMKGSICWIFILNHFGSVGKLVIFNFIYFPCLVDSSVLTMLYFGNVRKMAVFNFLVWLILLSSLHFISIVFLRLACSGVSAICLNSAILFAFFNLILFWCCILLNTLIDIFFFHCLLFPSLCNPDRIHVFSSFSLIWCFLIFPIISLP
jgi:hypothetical protein